jgi:hypothetical protein
MTTAAAIVTIAAARQWRPAPLQALGGLLLVLSAAGLWLAPRLFFASWLAAWWWCLGLVLGALLNGWIHPLTGGRWGLAIRPLLQPLACRLPALLLLALPWVAGVHRLYPWAHEPASTWAQGLSQPRFLIAWLSPTFFSARLVVDALVFLWLAGRAGRPMRKGRAAASLMLYGLVGSLAAVDLLASLLPGWHSSAFGLRTLAGQWLGGTALLVVLIGTTGDQLADGPALPPVSRDLGNLLLMNVMLWAYLAYMEFLIIWAENLPHEVMWFAPRLDSGWRWAGLVLGLGQGLLAVLPLLLRAVKDRPRRLAVVAVGLLATSALDAGWLLVPSVDAHNGHAAWLLPLHVIGLALLLFGDLPARLRARALLPVEVADGAR